MESLSLIDSFQEFKEFKDIDRATLMNILESVFRSTIKRQFGDDENFDFIVNVDKGDLEIWRNREIVHDGEVEDGNKEISYAEAILIEPDFEIGEEVSEEVKMEDFGRRIVLSLRQNLMSKIMELEKDNIYASYKDRVGDLITGEVYQVWKREILILDDEDNELILPKTEQISNDRFRKGDTVRAVVVRVEMKNNKPLIILSRTSPLFLRAKVAVESYDDRIDPVGACVGMKGARIHGIVRELRNENIDVINYSANTELFIQRSLSPAKVTAIKLDRTKMTAEVFLKPDQVSLAIGRGGFNIKLAGELVGFDIDVYRDVDEDDNDDVALDEFKDEIEGWVIAELKSIGCDSAKSVIEQSVEELVRRTDLEIETVEDLMRVLKQEFED